MTQLRSLALLLLAGLFISPAAAQSNAPGVPYGGQFSGISLSEADLRCYQGGNDIIKYNKIRSLEQRQISADQYLWIFTDEEGRVHYLYFGHDTTCQVYGRR